MFSIAQLPNLITVARLLMVPVTIWLIMTNRVEAAFWLFVLAGVSDGVDGFIAKRFNATTMIGSYLDPLADKALLSGVFVTLGLKGLCPDWLVVLIVFRDLMIVGAVLLGYAARLPLKISPMIVSKINTACQIALAALLLAVYGLGVAAMGLVETLVVVVAVTTVASGAAYLARWLRLASQGTGEE